MGSSPIVGSIYMLYICLHCKSSFKDKPSSNRKFCTTSCSAQHNNIGVKRRKRKIVLCVFCRDEIKGKGKKYCSYDCLSKDSIKKITTLIENGSLNLSSIQVKKYLIHKHGEKCMKCNWDKRHPITNKVPIELEHIDGDSSNNRINNVILLCPNCHSLTLTYKALNVGNGRHSRRQRYKEGKSF